MRVLQTTLLTGPYDWSPSVLPREEFDARIAAVRGAVKAAGAGGLLVHGYAAEYGALNYLTGFVPKLDQALALLPLEGDIRLIVSGTELMIPQAKLLTWVEDVRPFANVPKLVAEWAQGAVLASWGAAGLMHRLHAGIAAAAGPLMPLDDTLDPIRRRKSPREIDLMRAACGMLDAGLKAFAAAAKDGARTAAIAAERAAIAKGAQDARALVSLRAGGVPLPVDGPENPAFDPLLATLAVRHAGYWAEGSTTVSSSRRPAQDAAEAALAALLNAARAGAPLPAGGSHAIGLSLDDGGAAFEAGATYALKAGSDGALASAMVRIGPGGAEILWGRGNHDLASSVT